MRQKVYREVVCCVCGKTFTTCATSAKACSVQCRNAKRRKEFHEKEDHEQRLADKKRKNPNRPKSLSPTEQELWDIALEAAKAGTSYGKVVCRKKVLI